MDYRGNSFQGENMSRERKPGRKLPKSANDTEKKLLQAKSFIENQKTCNIKKKLIYHLKLAVLGVVVEYPLK